MDKNILLIANFTAGRGRCATQIHEVIREFAAQGYGMDVRITTRRGHAAELAREYAESREVIVCAGGDGTLNEVITGILTSPGRPKIGYIPCGSTNDFATTLHLSGEFSKAAARIALLEKTVTLDVGRFQDRYFSYVASFGAFTETSYTTPQEMKNSLGHLAYFIEGVKNLQSLRPYHLRLDIDDQTYEDDFIFGAVSNSTSIAGLVKLDEDFVSLNDGLLEVLLIRNPQRLDELGRIAFNLSAKNYTDPAIQLLQGRKIHVSNPNRVPFTLDGEYGGDDEQILIENIPSAIELYV